MTRMTEKKSIWDLIGGVAPTKLYAIVIIVAAITLLTVKAPPPSIMPNVQRAYDYIEGVKPGTVVVFESENSYAYFMSHLPASVALLRHVLSKNVKLIVFGTHSDSPLIWDYMMAPEIKDVMDKYGYVYGKNWVNLGYSPGLETAVAAFGANTWFTGSDFSGTPLSDLSMMQDIKTGKDIGLWIQGGYQHLWVIRQMVAKYKTPFIIASHEEFIVEGPVFVESGQMVSFVHGWAGAVMYETLIKRAGLATAGSATISVLYYAVLVVIVMGNISWFGKKLFGGD